MKFTHKYKITLIPDSLTAGNDVAIHRQYTVSPTPTVLVQ